MNRNCFWAALAAAALSLVSCDKEPANPTPDPDPDIEVVDLSAGGSANCYVLDAPGDYSFDATVRGNGAATEGLPAPEKLQPAGASLVWQSEKGMVSNLKYEYGKISFTLSDKHGNALVAAVSASGKILWSWHIWCPEDKLESSEAKSGYEVLNMNLGALRVMPVSMSDAKTYGMLYQWGRKDPFPASPSAFGDVTTVGAKLYDAEGKEVKISNSSWTSLDCNTLEYAVSHPTVCLSNAAQYPANRDWLASGKGNDALWGNPYGAVRDSENDYPNKGEKSIYDPCPAGYRVPPVDAFRYFTTSGGYSEDIRTFDIADLNADGALNAGDYNRGWLFNMKSGSQFFPAAARYDGTYAMLYGSKSGLWGAYWSNSPALSLSSVDSEGMGFVALSFGNDEVISVSPSASSSRADAFSVRCVKE